MQWRKKEMHGWRLVKKGNIIIIISNLMTVNSNWTCRSIKEMQLLNHAPLDTQVNVWTFSFSGNNRGFPA